MRLQISILRTETGYRAIETQMRCVGEGATPMESLTDLVSNRGHDAKDLTVLWNTLNLLPQEMFEGNEDLLDNPHVDGGIDSDESNGAPTAVPPAFGVPPEVLEMIHTHLPAAAAAWSRRNDTHAVATLVTALVTLEVTSNDKVKSWIEERIAFLLGIKS